MNTSDDKVEQEKTCSTGMNGRSSVDRSCFIEGESSAELFIVRSGKIEFSKQEGKGAVELAVLGRAVLSESLLYWIINQKCNCSGY
jgi:hypothetical protein